MGRWTQATNPGHWRPLRVGDRSRGLSRRRLQPVLDRTRRGGMAARTDRPRHGRFAAIPGVAADAAELAHKFRNEANRARPNSASAPARKPRTKIQKRPRLGLWAATGFGSGEATSACSRSIIRRAMYSVTASTMVATSWDSARTIRPNRV